MKNKIMLIVLFLFVFNYFYAEEIKIKKVSASSTLESPSNLYKVENLIDGTNNSWVEGVADFGENVKITIEFEKKVLLSEFYIKNGYGDYKHFYANNRIKCLSCGFQNRGGAFIMLEDTPGFQKIKFDVPIETNKLELTIIDVYKGEKYNDTAISEISFKNWFDLNHSEMSSSIIEYRINDLYEIYNKKNDLIDNRPNKSFFSFERNDNRHREDWFHSQLKVMYYPLTDGNLYFVTSLDSNFFGQNRTSSYEDNYILFSKLKNGKLICDQSLCPSLGDEEDIKYLNLIKLKMNNDQKVFIEKYLKLISSVEEAKETNLPFFCDLFTLRQFKTDYALQFYINDYVNLPTKVMCMFPGYWYKLNYNASNSKIVEVSLP